MNDLSRREFLEKIGGGVVAGAVLSSLPGVVKGQEAEPPIESPYDNPDIRINNLGYVSMIFDEISPRYYSPDTILPIQHEHSPLGIRHINSFLPVLENALERIGLERLGQYDSLYLVPGQFFRIPESSRSIIYSNGIPIGLSNTARLISNVPNFMGGVINLNLATQNVESVNFTAADHLRFLTIHESMHERGLIFPEKISLTTGERVQFSNMHHPVPLGFYNEQNHSRLVHPHEDILGGGPNHNYSESSFTRSPLALFLTGFLTIDEFNNSYAESKPYLLEVDDSGGVYSIQYFTADSLIRELDSTDNSWGASVNQLRANGGLERFLPGNRIPEEGLKHKVGIVPLLMVERQALRRPDLGNGKTTQDNIADFVLSLDQFSNFMNTQFRGMIEAEVVTANT